MKKELVKLTELLEDKDFSRKTIEYNPDFRSISISEKDSGISRADRIFLDIPTQKFTTKNFTYHPILDENNNPALISEEVTENLYLLGKIGCEDSLKTMKKICNLYSSKSLSSKGRLISEELIKVLPEYLQSTKNAYFIDKAKEHEWISCLYGKKNHDSYVYVCNRGKIESLFIGSAKGAGIIYYSTIRPLILLPKNTIVEVSSDESLKLSLNKK